LILIKKGLVVYEFTLIKPAKANNPASKPNILLYSLYSAKCVTG